MLANLGVVMKGICLLVGEIVVYGGGGTFLIWCIGQSVMDWRARRGKG